MATKVDSGISIDWIPEFSSYSPSQSCDVRAVCSLKAPLFTPDESSRARLDLVAVIDTSGSMSGDLHLVKSSLEFVISQLRDTDRMSLVTYETSVSVQFGLTRMTPLNKAEKKKVVNNLSVGDMTNLCEGLLIGMYEVIDRGDDKADVASVLLFTDGKANVGIVKKEDILQEMKKAINPPEEYTPFKGTVNTFGYSSDHDARLLELISSEGGGVYHYIPSKDKIRETFSNCLGGLVSTLSKDITMRFTASGDNSITCIHTPRASTWETKSKICEAIVGDLQSEEERDILVELKVPEVSGACSTPVVSCQLKYFNVIAKRDVTNECDLILERSILLNIIIKVHYNSEPYIFFKDSNNHRASKKVDMQSNRLLVTRVLKHAQQMADIEKFEEAKVSLQEAMDKISNSISHEEEYCQKLIKDLKNVADSLRSKDVYKSHGAHYLISKGQSHATQRSNFTLEDNLYSSSSRALLVAKAKESK